MRPRRRRTEVGFTLVELMIVVAIIGILAAIAMPAFSRYVRKSRAAEAAGHLNRMWAGSITYYEADHFEQVVGGSRALARQFPGPASEAVGGAAADCCAFNGAKCPGSDPGFEGAVWQSLDFSLPEPYSYKPSYRSANRGAQAEFHAVATGNLDCDAIHATFTRRGSISLRGDVLGGGAPEIANELE